MRLEVIYPSIKSAEIEQLAEVEESERVLNAQFQTILDMRYLGVRSRPVEEPVELVDASLE